MAKKTVNNTDVKQAKVQVKDLEVFGDGDLFKLISKASSKNEGWMKSTKAMFTGRGCVIQVTTQQGDNVAEAVTYVPGITIMEKVDADGKVISRRFEHMNFLERFQAFI